MQKGKWSRKWLIAFCAVLLAFTMHWTTEDQFLRIPRADFHSDRLGAITRGSPIPLLGVSWMSKPSPPAIAVIPWLKRIASELSPHWPFSDEFPLRVALCKFVRSEVRIVTAGHAIEEINTSQSGSENAVSGEIIVHSENTETAIQDDGIITEKLRGQDVREAFVSNFLKPFAVVETYQMPSGELLSTAAYSDVSYAASNSTRFIRTSFSGVSISGVGRPSPVNAASRELGLVISAVKKGAQEAFLLAGQSDFEVVDVDDEIDYSVAVFTHPSINLVSTPAKLAQRSLYMRSQVRVVLNLTANF